MNRKTVNMDNVNYSLNDIRSEYYEAVQAIAAALSVGLVRSETNFEDFCEKLESAIRTSGWTMGRMAHVVLIVSRFGGGAEYQVQARRDLYKWVESAAEKAMSEDVNDALVGLGK